MLYNLVFPQKAAHVIHKEQQIHYLCLSQEYYTVISKTMLKLSNPNNFPCNSPLEYKRRIGLAIPRVVNVNGMACAGRRLRVLWLRPMPWVRRVVEEPLPSVRELWSAWRTISGWVVGYFPGDGGMSAARTIYAKGSVPKEISPWLFRAEPCLLGLTSLTRKPELSPFSLIPTPLLGSLIISWLMLPSLT